VSSQTVTLFCRGTACRLEPWGPEADPIHITLTPGVWVQPDPSGEVLFYTSERSLGLGLNTALMLGLCRPAEKSETSHAAAKHREQRALERERLLTSVERLAAAVRAAAAVRSPLGTWANRPTPSETLDRLAEYCEQIVRDRHDSG
jgi:hypothetical protein